MALRIASEQLQAQTEVVLFLQTIYVLLHFLFFLHNFNVKINRGYDPKVRIRTMSCCQHDVFSFSRSPASASA